MHEPSRISKYIYFPKKKTNKIEFGEGCMSLPKAHTEEPRRHIQNVKIYIPNEKTNKSEFGEGCMSPPKAHTEEPRRHIQNVKIYTF